MILFSLLPQADLGLNGHWEDASHFKVQNHLKGITVEKGRAFMTKHAHESPSSTIFISFLLSNYTWEETLSDPRYKFTETQTEDYNPQPLESEEFVTLTTSTTNQPNFKRRTVHSYFSAIR